MILPLSGQTQSTDDDGVYAQIVLFDGFDPLDATAPFEVLAAGSDAAGGDLQVEWCLPKGPGRW